MWFSPSPTFKAGSFPRRVLPRAQPCHLCGQKPSSLQLSVPLETFALHVPACSPPRVPSSYPWANPGCQKLSKSPKVTRIQTPVSLTPPSQGDPERQVDWVEINDSEFGAQDETQGCLFGLQAGTEEATSLSAPLCLPEHGENIFYLAVENQTSVGKCWKDYS